MRSTRSVRPAILGAACAALLGLTALGAPAQSAPAPGATPATPDSKKQQARVLFRKGIKAFDDGYYNEALKLFQAAYKLYPSPKIHTRIALCYKWLGNNLKALEHYEIFLKKFPKKPTKPRDIALRKRIETRMVPQLLAVIGQIHIVIEKPLGAEVRINGKPVGQAPMDRVFRINPGMVAVSASATKHYGWKKDLTIKPKQTMKLRIVLVKIKPKVIKKVIKIKAKPIYKRWWFWTAIGAVVAGAAIPLSIVYGTIEKPRDLRGTTIHHDNLTVRW